MTQAIRVLLVDDAAFMRRSLAKLLKGEEAVEIVGEAANGLEALEQCAALRPDVICLDIDMPEMNGITAAKHIMSSRPTPIIVVSSMTDRSDIPFEALRLGAMDFFPKPSSMSGNIGEQTRHLLYLIRNAHQVRRECIHRVHITPSETVAETSPKVGHVIVVGGTMGSVGGLIQILSSLPTRVDPGVAVVFQGPIHPMIEKSFLSSVEGFLGWRVMVPVGPTRLRAGSAVFIPPGRKASGVDGVLVVEEDPSPFPLDDLFEWVGSQFGERSTVVLLAGDRDSGEKGIIQAHEHGASCFVQDESSALFRTWAPVVREGAEFLDLGSIIDSVVSRLDQANGRAK